MDGRVEGTPGGLINKFETHDVFKRRRINFLGDDFLVSIEQVESRCGGGVEESPVVRFTLRIPNVDPVVKVVVFHEIVPLLGVLQQIDSHDLETLVVPAGEDVVDKGSHLLAMSTGRLVEEEERERRLDIVELELSIVTQAESKVGSGHAELVEANLAVFAFDIGLERGVGPIGKVGEVIAFGNLRKEHIHAHDFALDRVVNDAVGHDVEADAVRSGTLDEVNGGWRDAVRDLNQGLVEELVKFAMQLIETPRTRVSKIVVVEEMLLGIFVTAKSHGLGGVGIQEFGREFGFDERLDKEAERATIEAANEILLVVFNLLVELVNLLGEFLSLFGVFGQFTAFVEEFGLDGTFLRDEDTKVDERLGLRVAMDGKRFDGVLGSVGNGEFEILVFAQQELVVAAGIEKEEVETFVQLVGEGDLSVALVVEVDGVVAIDLVGKVASNDGIAVGELRSPNGEGASSSSRHGKDGAEEQ